MSTTNVKCECCGKMFDKPNKEINRSKKKGFANCCSRSCTATLRNKCLPNEYWKKQYKKHPTLKGHENNRLDELSPFRSFLNKGRASMRNKTVNIDAEYLKKLWESQKGICPYTKIKMILPKSTTGNVSVHSLKKASIDRIDSSKGYIKGNVEFVCMAINLAKNNRTKEEMNQFISDIVTSWNTLGITQSQPT